MRPNFLPFLKPSYSVTYTQAIYNSLVAASLREAESSCTCSVDARDHVGILTDDVMKNVNRT